MPTKRERYPRWILWIRRHLNPSNVLQCVRCELMEHVGPDCLCEGCLVECETDPELADVWLQDE